MGGARCYTGVEPKYHRRNGLAEVRSQGASVDFSNGLGSRTTGTQGPVKLGQEET